MDPNHIRAVASQVRAGSTRALARGLTWVERGGAAADALLEELYRDTDRAHVVGVTGAPGSGKSTLVHALTAEARRREMTVGIIAVDPSSPFSGGAILGDRIRMNDLTLDPGVFIRSMATRGALGGLCQATGAAVDLVSAAGKDLVIVETVGVGQDEVDIMQIAHSTIVVSVPGLGDEIQALKAGIIEIADIHVVNKADRDGAERVMAEIRGMLAFGMSDSGWTTPVLRSVATRGEGAPAVLDDVARHFRYLHDSGAIHPRKHRIAESRILKVAQVLVSQTLKGPLEIRDSDFAGEIERVVRRELTPSQCARRLLTRASETERASSHV